MGRKGLLMCVMMLNLLSCGGDEFHVRVGTKFPF